MLCFGIFFQSIALAVTHPNLYELSGKNVQVSYATSSLTGEPRLHYRDKKHDLNFTGDEIRVLRTEIGTQVTVTIHQVPDLKTVTATLLIPDINLENDAVLFKTFLIRTRHWTTFSGPELVKGPVQTYSKVALKGKASHVNFIGTNLSGAVTLSPTCGGGITPGQDCTAPFANAWVSVLDFWGNTAATAQTDAEGMFGVYVFPGHYTIRIGLLHEGPPPLPLPAAPSPEEPSTLSAEPANSATDILVFPNYPLCPETRVTVPKTGSAFLNIDCDTGIRSPTYEEVN